MSAPIFSIFCIDYRFDAMLANFYDGIGLEYNYFACTNAGASLCLGYNKYCVNSCHNCGCDPNNSSMVTLKRGIIENLNIALTLKDIKDIYLINHQDCGAIRAFLSCSGYPDFGKNNAKEIKINSKLLVYAEEYMKKKQPDKNYILGLIDINGTVAYFDKTTKLWTIIFLGEFHDPKGLWFGLKVNDTYSPNHP